MSELAKNCIRGVLRTIRKRSDTNLFWWKGPPYNAGDWTGPYLYKAITNNEPTYKESSNRSLSTVFFTVGSLTRWICEDSIIWGSGLLDRDEVFWRPYETVAVRGPYTRDRFHELGYPCPSLYGDPAILLPRYLKIPCQQIRHKIGIIPHYSNIQEVSKNFGQNDDFHIVDIRWPLEKVIQAILTCHYVISSSLHGLIFSHSYGIPAARVEFMTKVGGDGVKFDDYYAAGGVYNKLAPLVITGKIGSVELEQYVESSPQPDLEPLIEPLLKSCPFMKN